MPINMPNDVTRSRRISRYVEAAQPDVCTTNSTVRKEQSVKRRYGNRKQLFDIFILLLKRMVNCTNHL